MKTLFTLPILALTALSAFSQIPNANFEEWVLSEFYEEPVGWTTDNSESAQTVFRDDEAYEGNYAMRVVAQPIGVGSYGEAKTTVAMDALPTSLDFYVRTMQENGTGLAGLTFYAGEEIVGNNFWFGTETVEDWTLVSIPFVQNSQITHVDIMVMAEVGDFAPGEAWIAVDQMAFSIPTSARNTAKDRPIRIFPNPAVDFVQVALHRAGGGSMELTDLTGKRVMTAALAAAQSHVAISDLAPGIYLATIFDRDGQRLRTVKLVKQAL